MTDKDAEAQNGSRRWERITVIVLVLSAILVVPLTIIGLGFAPGDDLLRDVARAVSGRDWGSVILMRPELSPSLSTHPGWDAILRCLHTAGLEKDELVSWSIVFLAILAFLPAMIFLRRPELFILLIAVAALLDFSTFERLFWGRPYLAEITFLMTCLFLWDRFQDGRTHGGLIALLIALVALRVWIRSTIVMLGIPLSAVWLSACFTRRWRPALVISVCGLAGIVLGCLLTGTPVEFAEYNLMHFYRTLFRAESAGVVVKELGPLRATPRLFMFLATFAVYRVAVKTKPAGMTHPAFILAMVGWALSFWISRFWFEYGFPATCVWLSLALQAEADKRLTARPPLRAALAGLFCAALIISGVVLRADRWRKNPVCEAVNVQNLYESDPSWFPDGDGILYSASMQVFFTFYYMFPDTGWRYATGMESGFMRQEDLAVYEAIHVTGQAESYRPWLNKMKHGDRLVLVLPPSACVAEGFPSLEWRFVAPEYWFGRPRPAETNSTDGVQ